MRKKCQFYCQPSIKQEAVICEFFGKKNRFGKTEVCGTFGFLIEIRLCAVVNYFTRI